MFQRDHIASRYLDIMDEILSLPPQATFILWCRKGYEEIVKSTLKDGVDIHADDDRALSLAASEWKYRDG